MTRRLSLLHQVFKSRQVETADIDLAFAVDDLLRKRLRQKWASPLFAFCPNVFSYSGLAPFGHDCRVVQFNPDNLVSVPPTVSMPSF
jgi:hypothetical protein